MMNLTEEAMVTIFMAFLYEPITASLNYSILHGVFSFKWV
jgi:hypothetical protein